jgi:hypothetical protein
MDVASNAGNDVRVDPLQVIASKEGALTAEGLDDARVNGRRRLIKTGVPAIRRTFSCACAQLGCEVAIMR